jgi:hypothetical protein
MTESLSVENQILLLCARRDVDAADENVGALAALVRSGVDWDALLAAALDHGLLPLLYERLEELGKDNIPAAVMARLRSAYFTNLLRHDRLTADLFEVVGALRGEGVEAIVLKGGALAPTVYPDPAQRPMVDLDLLVRPEQMERAGAVFQSLGYQLSSAVPARMVAFQQRFGGGLEWQRTRNGKLTCLDVHHHLVELDWCWAAYPVELDALWADARPLALDGTEALQLSAEDALIHLCLHPLLNHGYASPLVGYADIERVIAAKEAVLSWPRLVERAGRFRVKTVLYWGLQGTHRLLGTPVPSEVLDALRPSSLRLHLLHKIAPLQPDTMLQGASRPPSGLKQGLRYAALADPIGAGAGMVRRLLFPGEEWLATRYGLQTRGRARLYQLIHPMRLARATLRGLYRPLIESSLE